MTICVGVFVLITSYLLDTSFSSLIVKISVAEVFGYTKLVSTQKRQDARLSVCLHLVEHPLSVFQRSEPHRHCMLVTSFPLLSVRSFWLHRAWLSPKKTSWVTIGVPMLGKAKPKLSMPQPAAWKQLVCLLIVSPKPFQIMMQAQWFKFLLEASLL